MNRLQNKTFWIALASAIVLLVQQLGLDIFPDNILDIVNTALLIATILGVVIDPTTQGIFDKKGGE
ncbi:MAG: phage holin [Culicoidibacterales bacterium]